MREENLLPGLEGRCGACGTRGLEMRELWCGSRLYRTGRCARCRYDHSILMRKL